MKAKSFDARLNDLVSRWREEANDLSRVNRFGNYPDQSTRVKQHMVLTTLRRCADALQKQLKGRIKEHD